MMHNPRADLEDVSRGRFTPVFSKTTSCVRCGSRIGTVQGLRLADSNTGPVETDEGKDADFGHLEEDDILELALRLLADTGIADNLPASMRLIEHIAETAAYRRAQQSSSTKVTELMLMSARASEMADDFRQDPDDAQDTGLGDVRPFSR